MHGHSYLEQFNKENIGELLDFVKNNNTIEVKNEFSKKLVQLFKNLRDKKILTLHNFSCCNSDGVYEVEYFYDLFVKAKLYDSITGYIFYHEQSMMTIREFDYVYVSYGLYDFLAETCEEHDKNVLAFVNKEILPEIEKAGLKYQWKNKLGEKIKIY